MLGERRRAAVRYGILVVSRRARLPVRLEPRDPGACRVTIRYATLAILMTKPTVRCLANACLLVVRISGPLVSSATGGNRDLVPRDCRLLAIWPAPVNHDVCFKEAGFSLFGDNDADWDQAAERLLARVVGILSRHGAPKLVSKPLRDNLPWYLRPFRAARELPLIEQALLPMRLDFLPQFHARFGENRVI